MKRFTQHWRYAEPLARHAWRWYINRRDVTIDQMSRSSHEAWISCNNVWQKMKQSERDILELYFRTGNDPSQAADVLRKWASENNTEVWQMMRVIKWAYKAWAVDRGIADDVGEESEGFRTETR